LEMKEDPEKARIAHFHGPLTAGPVTISWKIPPKLALQRGDQPTDFVDISEDCAPRLLIDRALTSTRQQLAEFVFEGSTFTPNGTVTRQVEQPNGTQDILSPTLVADSTGQITWSFAPTCTMPVGTYTILAIDDVTGLASNSVAETITLNEQLCPPPPSTTPSAPSNVSASVGDRTIYLTWRQPGPPVDHFRIDVEKQCVGCADFTGIGTFVVNDSSALIDREPNAGAIENGASYDFTVRAERNGLLSDESFSYPIRAIPGMISDTTRRCVDGRMLHVCPPVDESGRPTPLIFLHGFIGSGAVDGGGTWAWTMDFMKKQLEWTYGGRLYHCNERTATFVDNGIGNLYPSQLFGLFHFGPRDCPIDPLFELSAQQATADFFSVDFGNNVASYPIPPVDPNSASLSPGGLAHQGEEVSLFINFLKHQGESWGESANKRFSVVAHSIGGLAARRYFVDHADDAHREVYQFVTYGTPHFGADVDGLVNALIHKTDQEVGQLLGVPARELALFLGKLGNSGAALEARFKGFFTASGNQIYPCYPGTFLNIDCALDSFLVLLNEQRLPDGIKYTSIFGSAPVFFDIEIGDRAKGEPHSTKWDGLVPVSSADLTGRFGSFITQTSAPLRAIETNRSHMGEGNDFPAILCALDIHCLTVTVKSPVDLEVVAPDGRAMTRRLTATRSFIYFGYPVTSLTSCRPRRPRS